MVTFPNPRSHHPYHMHDMIRGQPAFVQETLDRLEDASAEAFLGAPRRLVLTGCGTSFHAAMYGAELLQFAFGSARPVRVIHAYDLLFREESLEDTTVLGMSHSGTTSTTNQALARARRSAARVVAICGLAGTPIDRVAEEVLVLGSVHDHSWANTMSYTTQLTALAVLARDAGARSPAFAQMEPASLPHLLERALRCEPAARVLARKVAGRERVTFLGSGLDAITALEAALKIRETCSFPASGYHVEQFLHGPFLSLDRSEAVVALRSREDGRRYGTILRSLSRTGAGVMTAGDAQGADLPLPATHDLLRPVLSVVPMQFLAYYVALKRKANPDIMRSDVPRYREGLAPIFA